jgi:transposase InsO family protein
VRPPKPRSPTWKAFLTNHVQDLVALDCFVVPTVRHTVRFVLVILAHERRRVVHFNITEHPTAQWTAQQVVEAFPWETAPRDLLHDRDRIDGASFRQRVQYMGIEEVLITPKNLWQNPYVERLIGSIRRECLDHVIVLHEQHLHQVLTEYFDIIITGAHTEHWTWIVHGRGRSNAQRVVRSRKSQKWVGCITTMSGEPRDDTGDNLPISHGDEFSGPTSNSWA